jgi:hypothetical protein
VAGGTVGTGVTGAVGHTVGVTVTVGATVTVGVTVVTVGVGVTVAVDVSEDPVRAVPAEAAEAVPVLRTPQVAKPTAVMPRPSPTPEIVVPAFMKPPWCFADG